MRKSKKSNLPPFVAISWETLNSQAYRQLNFASAKLLPYLLGKPKLRFDDLNYYESTFSFSYGEAESLGFARQTFSRCIKDLQVGGFLVKVSSGGLRGESKSYSRYRLSNLWRTREAEARGKMAIYRIQSINGQGLTH